MNRRMELDLMRLLHGELPEEQARALRARLERDPALAEAYRRLGRSWEELALPPAAPVPLGFAQRAAALATAERSAQTAPTPVWVRAAAALALILGTAVGIEVGGSWPLGERKPAAVTQQDGTVETADQDETASTIDGSLAEGYWTAMDELDGGTSESEEARP